MKNKVSKLFKDKLFLVMLVLGLLTIVAAAGVVTIQRGSGLENNPYLSMEDDGNRIAEEAKEQEDQLAGISEIETEAETELALEETEAESYQETEEVAQAGAGNEAASALVLNYTEADKLSWPVRGSVLIDYSMETTTYFPTLEQYKCSPGIVLQSEVSTPVYVPANAQVMEVSSNEELGNFVTLDLGNGYTAVCGQLKEIAAVQGDFLEKGELLGYVAEPTKYYSVEGSNVYFEVDYNGQPVDPLDYLE